MMNTAHVELINKIKSVILSYAESCTLPGNCLDERLCSTCFLGGAKELGEEILDIIKEYERGENNKWNIKE